jgi:hypothetical protein
MPRNPEQGRTKEQQPLPYYLASTFKTRADGEYPYQQVQELIYDPNSGLSAFHFERKPRDPRLPPLERPWFVVVLGKRPPEAFEQHLREILASGEMTTLPLETVVTLAQRRAHETKKGSWVEGHYGAGLSMPEATIHVQRRNPNKEKLKRKQQDKSRRRNRGK